MLYFVGERLVPGSILEVVVNGVPVKVLPAMFHSSEVMDARLPTSRDLRDARREPQRPDRRLVALRRAMK